MRRPASHESAESTSRPSSMAAESSSSTLPDPSGDRGDVGVADEHRGVLVRAG